MFKSKFNHPFNLFQTYEKQFSFLSYLFSLNLIVLFFKTFLRRYVSTLEGQLVNKIFPYEICLKIMKLKKKIETTKYHYDNWIVLMNCCMWVIQLEITPSSLSTPYKHYSYRQINC